ncbi:MAG: TlpA disulfide reductase family protein [Bacteroidota bacterium]
MYSKTTTIGLIFLLLVGAACNSKKAGDNDFVVKGKLSNSSGGYLLLEELTPKDVIPVDSVKLGDDGSFFFRHQPKETGFYFLTLDTKNHVSLLIQKGETVEYYGDYASLGKNYQISGSPGSDQMKLINDKLNENYVKVDSLRKMLDINKYRPNFIEVKKQLDTAYVQIRTKHRVFMQQFIESHLTSLASLIVIYQNFGSSHVFSERKDIALFDKLAKSIITAYPENSHAIEFNKSVANIHKKIEEENAIDRSLSIGSVAPEIQLPDTNKTPFSLSSLKGKVVLIDFWASFHTPCRKLNGLLAAIYNKYKSKGFEILGVSMDREEKDWKACIRKDKMTWKQVSDLLYFDGPVAKQYNVTGIPYLMLIDKSGKIIAKGIKASELEKKITEALR